MVGNNMPVPPLERRLVREWRETHGMTLNELGKGFRPKRNRHLVHQIENGKGSMTVTLILAAIHAFGRVGKPIGPEDASDQVLLAIFFGGPDAREARAAMAKAAREIIALGGGAQE